MTRLLVPALCVLAIAAPASGKDSLGIFGDWGAFRDPAGPRCYAIAKPAPSRARRDHVPFASVGTWPDRNVRGQISVRLSRSIDRERDIVLRVGDKRFELVGNGANAWARDRAADAAIVAAMRAAGSMTISAADANGRRFSNRYDLNGAATAMDAATVACARRS